LTKRGAGIGFIAISAFLISIKYISVAIIGLEIGIGNGKLQLGNTLNSFSIIALLAGIAYLVWAEFEEFKK
jgi:hypothetical protein